MGFDAHGSFDITVQGEVYIVRFYQNWNLEGAKAFFKAYKTIILKNKFERFGVLGDMRQFEGGTPDGMALFEEIATWCLANGQIARAQLINSDLTDYIVNQTTRGKDFFPIKTFENEAQALAWLSDLGLKIE
jgi:hypothetical protein